jgi:hypothetical protein
MGHVLKLIGKPRVQKDSDCQKHEAILSTQFITLSNDGIDFG